MGARLGVISAVVGAFVFAAAAFVTVTDADVNELLSGAPSERDADAAASRETRTVAQLPTADVATISTGETVSLSTHARAAERVLFEFTADW